MTANSPFMSPRRPIPFSPRPEGESESLPDPRPPAAPAEALRPARSDEPGFRRDPRGERADEGPPRPRATGEEFDLRGFARLLRRRAGFIALASGLVIAALLPLILAIEKTYSAQIRLLIDRPQAVALATPAAGPLPPLDLATEIERLQAQSNVQQVIDDLGLAELEEFNPPPPSANPLSLLLQAAARLVAGEDAVDLSSQVKWDPVIRNFYKALAIHRSGTTNVVEIAFSSRDPILAAQVPNRLVESYLDQRRAQAAAEAARAREWLTGRIEAQRARVQDIELRANEFRSLNSLDLEEPRTESTSQVAALNAQLSEIARTRAQYASALDELRAGNTTSAAIGAIASPLMSELRRDLQVQQRELARLRQTYGENHAEVASRRAAVAETERAIASEASRLADALTIRIESLDRERAETEAAIDGVRHAALLTGAKEVDYQVMAAELGRERSTLAALEEQFRRVDGEAILPVAEAEILSPATPPRFPDGRGRKFYLAVAILGALCLATTAACVREMLDRSARSQQQFWGLPGVVTAGLIPALDGRGAPTLPDRLRQSPNGAVADAMRWLALSIQRAGGGRMPDSLLVTSALPGEGASTTAAGLALALAEAGHGVLLVDVDPQGGSAHEQFGGPASPGFAELCAGQVGLDRVIRTHAETGVEYVAAGTERRGSLLESDGLQALMDHARARGRILIVEGAPVLASAEAAFLASQVEQCLLVARWGRTPLRVAELAIDRLIEHGGEPVAVALAQVDPQAHARYSFADSDLFSPALRRYRESAA
ncbi:GumC family protein [Rubellimicrobium aerolatum]|uniref:GumC family protein n=1 Tax=Rubellimicrobium aerolatum TaxID=490979 RepID=A0ABW0SE54_9RHOB|nr:polysaccharide biosynthesis tyrosine autokinase [Rubellimicrobium aerolatum]MBP1806806.1 uncharacterized protein involved in exopolysaccharide biosynthesis/Mrp family chromosome partitioning ATPase [Rubellimicrobium aerolatum]